MRTNKFSLIGMTLIILWLSFITGVVIDTQSKIKELSKDRDVLYELVVLELIRRESIKLKPYYDASGYRTIGIGVRNNDLDSITLDSAFQLMHIKFDGFYTIVDKEFPDHERHEKLAITLMAYNIGINKLKSLGHWERIKNRDSNLFEKWNQYVYYQSGNRFHKSDNLIKARKFEVALFKKDMETLESQREELNLTAKKKLENLKK